MRDPSLEEGKGKGSGRGKSPGGKSANAKAVAAAAKGKKRQAAQVSTHASWWVRVGLPLLLRLLLLLTHLLVWVLVCRSAVPAAAAVAVDRLLWLPMLSRPLIQPRVHLSNSPHRMITRVL